MNSTKTTRRGAPRPRRYGKSYRSGEIALLYLVGRSQRAKKILAELLERTEDAVDLVWGWCEGRRFPPQATNVISRQVEGVRRILGKGVRGKLRL
jgi:hypothetical protein